MNAKPAMLSGPLERSIETLRGVGPGLAERLARLGVRTVGDLLWLLPVRYEDRTEVRPLGTLRPGDRVRVEGEIMLAEVVFRRRRMLLCRLADGTGTLTLRFFHFNRVQQETLGRGARIECFGEVRAGPTGLEMVHPECRNAAAGETTETLTPVYPTTEGLHQARLRRLVDEALAALDNARIEDLLDGTLPAAWPALTDALNCVHRPSRDVDTVALETGRHPALRRLAFEELIAQRLSLRRAAEATTTRRAPAVAPAAAELDRFLAVLPFRLTPGQERAVDELLGDMQRPAPMHRLLQGDVGAGKTVVAAAAMHAAVAAGLQAALMAPTEILAEQHRRNLARWFEPLGVPLLLLTGSLPAAERRAVLDALRDGGAAIAIGTHALFQDDVEFDRLGLVVVDEQHRFGVEQRLRLNRKGERDGESPHQLIMTATPIPRTLAMTAYADLDYSVIDGVPAGRKPVTTVVMPEKRRAELVERIAGHCARGGQAYWVCPLIEESEALETSAAIELERQLAAALPDVRVGLVHGRLKSAEKEAVMRDFDRGDTGLLIATTVIEVGVDVPNASLMVIENAERMGLAQLHQLRGRVGRGDAESACVLLYRPPLTDVARERLTMMRSTSDGFRIAEKDLELRGPGEVLGTRQTGIATMRVADLRRDADLLPRVVAAADRIEREFPERIAPLIERWIKSGVEYAKV
jgi:ATP-dependent DNA helicase RecG